MLHNSDCVTGACSHGAHQIDRTQFHAVATSNIKSGDAVDIHIDPALARATVSATPYKESDVNEPQVVFGGVENREALTKVTAEELAAELLKRINPHGFDLEGPHSKDTPKRFVASLTELCTPLEEFNFTTFPTDSDDMVVVGPVPFFTLCAHHVVPFHGKAWVGYVPNGKVVGLSKLARTVKYMARGMWVQEELTQAVHNFINMKMQTRGIMVVMRAEHMCMSMRGVQVAGAITTTAKVSGVFADHDRTAKAEFMQWMEMSK